MLEYLGISDCCDGTLEMIMFENRHVVNGQGDFNATSTGSIDP